MACSPTAIKAYSEAMMGWQITVLRQADGGISPADFHSKTSDTVAAWQSGASGLDWIDQLVSEGNAVLVGGNGYPGVYTAKARYLLPQICDDPPGARPRWLREVGDTVAPEWPGRTVIHQEIVADCRPDEWLYVSAWDES